MMNLLPASKPRPAPPEALLAALDMNLAETLQAASRAECNQCLFFRKAARLYLQQNTISRNDGVGPSAVCAATIHDIAGRRSVLADVILAVILTLHPGRTCRGTGSARDQTLSMECDWHSATRKKRCG
jgi:hypothetical protein